MRPINKKCVILSAELDFQTPVVNKQDTDRLENYLIMDNFRYKTLIGCYKGNTEASFLVEYDNINEMVTLNKLAQHFDQETILLLDEDRNAVIYNESDNGLTQIPIGKLRNITPKQAQKLDAWSYCPINDQYYGVL